MGELTKSLKLEVLIGEFDYFFYQGRYDENLEELEFFWNFRNPVSIPVQTNDLDIKEYVELLYQCGVLYGFYATSEKSAQKWSKDLLTKSFEIFIHSKNYIRAALSANYLAVSYQRSGALEEAKVWVDLAYENYNASKNQEIDVFLEIILTQLLISFSEKTFDFSLNLIKKNEEHFQNCSNLYILAHYYNHRGIIKRNLKIDGAVNDYEIATNLFGEIRHKRFLSTAQNNLAWAFMAEDRYDEAISSALESLDTAMLTEDLRQIGSVYDTLAQFKIRIRNYYEAIGFADRAIEHLLKTEAYEYLVEAYQTKIVALSELGDFSEALNVYEIAKLIAQTQTSHSILKNLEQTYDRARIVQNENLHSKLDKSSLEKEDKRLINTLQDIYNDAVFSGEFESGLKKLSKFWDYKKPHQQIKIENTYSKLTQAELNLVVGDLYARLNKGRSDCQFQSVKFIKTAFDLFQKSGNSVRAALCATRLAGIHYWLGRLNSSRKFISTAYQLNKEINEIKLYSVIVDVLIRHSSKNYESCKAILYKYEKSFLSCNNQWLLAQFHNYRGIIRYQLGLPGVIDDFKCAFQYFGSVNNYQLQIFNLGHNVTCQVNIGTKRQT